MHTGVPTGVPAYTPKEECMDFSEMIRIRVEVEFGEDKNTRHVVQRYVETSGATRVIGWELKLMVEELMNHLGGYPNG